MKKKCFFWLIAFALCSILIFAIQAHAQETSAYLTKHSIQTSESDEFKYLLYTPENPVENMPLIVYLHGGSGKGDDLDLITSVSGFPQFVNDGTIENIGAYIIFPQLSSSQKGWAEAKVSVTELIDYICGTYNTDETRVSLTGHSMGGTGTWSIALSYPEAFCAIAPMSGSVQNTSDNISALANTPVWAMVGTADTIVDPSSSVDFISALKEVNPYAKITQFSEATHFDVPSLAYLDTDLNVIGWLLSNVRDVRIISYSEETVTVKTEVPGTYTLIFADYDADGRLNNMKFVTTDFSFGKTRIPLPENITLGSNDKIMLWSGFTHLRPLCEAYIIP